MLVSETAASIFGRSQTNELEIARLPHFQCVVPGVRARIVRLPQRDIISLRMLLNE